MENLCVECEERPVYIKKRKLCSTCYQKWNRINRKVGSPIEFDYSNQEIQHRCEINFIQNFFTHQNWLYHPAIFRWARFRYEPDFYDAERKVFIEVSGTRQAYYANREKYMEFAKTFPSINFEIRREDGDLIDISAVQQNWQ